MLQDFKAQQSKQKVISDFTLSAIRDVLKLSSTMSSTYAPHLDVNVEYQEEFTDIDITKPVSVVTFANPDSRADVYARLDAYDDGNNGFDCKLFEGIEDEPSYEGNISEIKHILHNIVKERMAERNMAKVKSAIEIAERREEPSQFDL